MKKYNIYSRLDYITQVEARSDTKAQRLADHLGKVYNYPTPMVAIPYDPRVKPHDRQAPIKLIAQHTKGKATP